MIAGDSKVSTIGDSGTHWALCWSKDPKALRALNRFSDG
jgi:hypothetical protein